LLKSDIFLNRLLNLLKSDIFWFYVSTLHKSDIKKSELNFDRDPISFESSPSEKYLNWREIVNILSNCEYKLTWYKPYSIKKKQITNRNVRVQ
jgi:hypothetical protein